MTFGVKLTYSFETVKKNVFLKANGFQANCQIIGTSQWDLPENLLRLIFGDFQNKTSLHFQLLNIVFTATNCHHSY